jgi:hypothetical protein
MAKPVQESRRRSARIHSRLPVTLYFSSKATAGEQTASTVDVSNQGLRVQTGTALKAGQLVSVICPWGETPFGEYRVVWVRTSGSRRPTEAGLERVN